MSDLKVTAELIDKMSGPLTNLNGLLNEFAKGVREGAAAELAAMEKKGATAVNTVGTGLKGVSVDAGKAGSAIHGIIGELNSVTQGGDRAADAALGLATQLGSAGKMLAGLVAGGVGGIFKMFSSDAETAAHSTTAVGEAAKVSAGQLAGGAIVSAGAYKGLSGIILAAKEAAKQASLDAIAAMAKEKLALEALAEMERKYYEKKSASGIARAANGSDLAIERRAERLALRDTFRDTVRPARAEAKDLATAALMAEGKADVLAFTASAATGIASISAVAAIAAAAVTAIAVSARSAADASDEMAQKLGISRDKLEALTLIAEENGGSVEAMQRVYDKLSKSMNKMDEDNEKTTYAFESLGIALDDIKDKKPEEVAALIVKNYEQIGKSAKATSAIVQLLGPNFRDQSIAIKEAGDKFGEYSDRVDKFGSTATDNLVKKGGEQEKAVSDLGLAWKGLKNSIGEYTGDIVTSLSEWAASSIKSIRSVFDEANKYGALREQVMQISPERRAQLSEQAKAAQKAGTIGPSNADFIKYRLELYDAELKKINAVKDARTADEKVRTDAEAAALKAKSEAAKPPPKKEGTPKVDEFAKAKEDMLRQIDLTKEATVAEKTLFETEQGRFKAFTPAQKAALIDLAKEVDLRIARTKEEQAFGNAQKQVKAEQEQVALLEYELTLTGKSADERERLLATKREELRLAKITEGLSPEHAAQIANATSNIVKNKETLSASLKDAAVVNGIIDSSEAAINASVQKNIQFAAGLLETKKISEDDYVRYVESQSKRLTDLNKKTAEEVSTFWQEAAKGMQSAMSDFFFDLMQGKLSSLGDRFKQMLDRMVSDALAANLAQSIFGNGFAKTGQLGGWAAQGMSWLGGLFGGARAAGGDVEAGRAYLVGENGPEPFVPKVSGTVLPNSALSKSSGKPIVVNITAMDSQDVRRALERDHRWLAGLINDSNRAYNM